MVKKKGLSIAEDAKKQMDAESFVNSPEDANEKLNNDENLGKNSDEKETINYSEKYIKWFSELSNKDVPIVGGKGASLGEMYNNKFPVPPGFVITAQSFEYFIKENKLKDKISEIIGSVEMEDTEALQNASKEIRKLIEEKDIPKDLEEEIIEAYHILSSEKIETKGISQDALNILKHAQEPIFVSVRSSATTEDLAEASFAGQQESFLNIKGDKKLINHVKKCFSSLYTARAIYYRKKQGFTEDQTLLAVVIQKMVDSEKSGVVFSRNPMTLENDIVLEAVYGLGEGIVSGKIRPDHYVASRDLQVKSIQTADKKIAIVKTSSGSNETVKLNPDRSISQVLTKGQILEIADIAIKLEDHYKKPQDIEFAMEDEKIYIVQSRPITTLKAKEKSGELSGNVLVQGLSASPGIGVGHVKIICSMKDLPKIKKGDVLVTTMTNPDMVVSMEKSVAIVTDEGGMTSHASIVSREMGIPCVVGTGNSTEKLKEGMVVTVDGNYGKIYEGEIAETTQAEIKPVVATEKIKIKVIVDLPEFAERAAKSGVDCIGLTRIEGMIASMGKHPLLYEKEKKLDEYTKILEEGIGKIIQPFKLMWIRSSDIRSDEYSSLKGAPEREINPMMGLHGIRFSLKHPEIFKAELQAVKNVAEKSPSKKIGVMFPLVISIEELKKAREIFNEYKTENMQGGVMVETPAAVQIIEDICKEGVDFISFGTNDLTQFTLSVDRGEDEVQYLYNELHPAVLSQIGHVIDVCKKYNVETSICGQAGSKPEMAKFLAKKGIDSISVNADAAYDISVIIKEIEEKIKQMPAETRDESETGEEKEEKIEEPKESELNEIEQARQERDGEKKNPRIITCDNCGKLAKVPFKPRPGKPVYCKPCYRKKKKQGESEKDREGEDEGDEKQLYKSEEALLPPPESNEQRADLDEIEDARESMEEAEEYGLLNKDNIKIPAEASDAIEEANKQAEEYEEDIGPIKPFNDLGHIEDKAEDIQFDNEQRNQDLSLENQNIEDDIETETKELTDDEINELEDDEENQSKENLGVYSPGTLDNDNNQEYAYDLDNY